MSYQRGDRILTGQGGRIYHLRLTFGALAQVCDVLDVDSLSALAGQMRERPKEAISGFANAMLNAARCEAEVVAADLPRLSVAISDLIVTAFCLQSRSPLTGELGPQNEVNVGSEGVASQLASPPQSRMRSTAPPSRGSGDETSFGLLPPIPFTSWLKIAVQIYRLSPSEFWAMSLTDFFALLPEPHTPPGREQLSILMTQFPDEAPS